MNNKWYKVFAVNGEVFADTGDLPYRVNIGTYLEKPIAFASSKNFLVTLCANSSLAYTAGNTPYISLIELGPYMFYDALMLAKKLK